MHFSIRQAALTAAVVPLLWLGLSGDAMAACPAVGKTWYSQQQCSRGPCYKYVVTGVRSGLASIAVYRNGYYQWIYEGPRYQYC